MKVADPKKKKYRIVKKLMSKTKTGGRLSNEVLRCIDVLTYSAKSFMNVYRSRKESTW